MDSCSLLFTSHLKGTINISFCLLTLTTVILEEGLSHCHLTENTANKAIH